MMSELSTSAPCAKCGKPVFAGQNFCPGCGSVLNKNREDWGITAKEFAIDTLGNAGNIAKEVLRHPGSKKVAGGAALGAAVGAALPIVTVAAGAALGAAIIGYQLLNKKGD